MSDRHNSMFAYLFRKRYDRFKPNRSYEFKRRFDWSKQPQAVQQRISEGYFNDPGSAQRFLDQHHATKVSQVREKRPATVPATLLSVAPAPFSALPLWRNRRRWVLRRNAGDPGEEGAQSIRTASGDVPRSLGSQ